VIAPATREPVPTTAVFTDPSAAGSDRWDALASDYDPSPQETEHDSLEPSHRLTCNNQPLRDGLNETGVHGVQEVAASIAQLHGSGLHRGIGISLRYLIV
jgi:hypothetical protein